MKKFLIIAISAIIIVGLVVMMRADGLIPAAAEEYGPEVLNVDVALEDADLSIFSGQASLKGFNLGQPDGYGDGLMFGLEAVDLKLQPSTLLGNHLIIDEISIEEPAIEAVLKGDLSNFEAFTNALGLPATDEAEEAASEFTMTIKRLAVTQPQMRVVKDGALALDETITLASFELTDLGTDEEGLTPQEVARHVMDFLYPQVAKVLVETGLKKQINALAEDGLDEISSKLKKETGDEVGGLIEGAVGDLLGGKKKKKTDESNN